ncbi:MAG: type II toxin-antitoxin system prevent-host-death family antitoxin [Myxococcaceae bacterium]
MVTVNVAELKAKLSHYLKYPERGESVLVTSHGTVIAKIVPEYEEAPEVDWSQFFIDNPPVSLLKKALPTSELIRKIRDEDL